MKELSIEQKAKKYDAAINTAKECYTDELSLHQPSKDVLEYIFPELKESEDERIMEALIDGFKDYKGWDEEWWNGVTVREIIAWLEKQGEQKTQAKSVIEIWKDMRLEIYQQASGNRHEPNYSDDSTKMFSLNDIDEIIEKMSEQKPADKVEQKLDTDFSDLRTWKYIVDLVWTEKEGIGQYLDSPFTEEVAKKLQKRFGNIEQKSAWSEEDENRINRLIAYFEDKESFTAEDDIVYANWLKSLKDRATWKPGEEQMTALRRMKAAIAGEGEIYKPLNSLYDDLKKL